MGLSRGKLRFVRVALAAAMVLLLSVLAAGPAQGDPSAPADSTQTVYGAIGSGSGASAATSGIGLQIQASAGTVNHLIISIESGTNRQVFTDSGALFPKPSGSSCVQNGVHSFNCTPGYYDFVVGSLGDMNDYFKMASNAHILAGANYNGANHFFVGGTGNDNMTGGPSGDGLRGGIGNDTVAGGGGHDLLHGDGGRDVLKGGSSGDSLYGDAGKDKLYGNSGKDQCRGGSGKDTFGSCEFKKQ